MFLFGASRRAKRKGRTLKFKLPKNGSMRSQGNLISDFAADEDDPFKNVDLTNYATLISDKSKMRDWEDELIKKRSVKANALAPISPADGLDAYKFQSSPDPDGGWLRPPLSTMVPTPFKTLAGETCWNPVNETNPNDTVGGWINGCRPGFTQSSMKYSTRKCCKPDPNYDYKNAVQYTALAALPKCGRGKTICKTSGKCVSVAEAKRFCGGVINLKSPKAQWLSNQLKILVQRYFMGSRMYGVDLGSGKLLLPKWLTNFTGVSGSTAAEKLGRVRLVLYLCELKGIPLLKRDKSGLGFKREFEKFSELVKYCGAMDQIGHIYTLYLNGSKTQLRIAGGGVADQYGGGVNSLDTALVRAFSDALHGAHASASSAGHTIKNIVKTHFEELHKGMYGGSQINTVLTAAANVANSSKTAETQTDMSIGSGLAPVEGEGVKLTRESGAFGKRRRRRHTRRRKGGRKSRKGGRKGSKKPSASVLRMCKRLKIKATKKVGKRRVYKKVSVLKKLIKRKLKMMKKRILRHRKHLLKKRKASRRSRKVHRKVRRHRRSRRV